MLPIAEPDLGIKWESVGVGEGCQEVITQLDH